MSKHTVRPVHPQCNLWSNNSAKCNCSDLWGYAPPMSAAGNREYLRLSRSDMRTRHGRRPGLSVRPANDDEENGSYGSAVLEAGLDSPLLLDSGLVGASDDELGDFWKESEFRRQFEDEK